MAATNKNVSPIDILKKVLTSTNLTPMMAPQPAIGGEMTDVAFDRFLRINDVAKIFGVSKRTVERMEKKGEIPKKTRITYKTVGWWESKFREFIEKTSPPC